MASGDEIEALNQRSGSCSLNGRQQTAEPVAVSDRLALRVLNRTGGTECVVESDAPVRVPHLASSVGAPPMSPRAARNMERPASDTCLAAVAITRRDQADVR
ncbi:hypothetical protein GCM10017687_34240 [Streptomyces echinatus]